MLIRRKGYRLSDSAVGFGYIPKAVNDLESKSELQK